jgi:hypothetical protein
MADITGRISIPWTEYKRLLDAEQELKSQQRGGHSAAKEKVDQNNAEDLEGAGPSLKLPLVAKNEGLPFSSRPTVLVKDDPVSATQLEPPQLAQDDHTFDPTTTVANVLETETPELVREGRSGNWWYLG